MTRGAWAAAAIVALLSFAVNLRQVPRTGFNPDESRWISRAHFLRDIGDPFGPTWEDRYTTRGQPPVGSYATGLGLVVQGRDLETNLPWEFSYAGKPGWERNIAEGRMPTVGDLSAARRASAGFVALTAAAVVLLGWLLAGPVAGWAAGILFAIHPFSAYIGSIATSDASFGLLIALAALVAAWLGGRPSWPAGIALGLALGLGGGAKLSPLLVAPVFGAIGFVVLVADRRGSRAAPHKRLGLILLAVPVVAGAVFVASYPYLWPDPVGRTRNLVAFRAEEMQAQATDWPVMAVPTRVEALRRIGVNFGARYGPPALAARSIEEATGHRFGLPPLDVAVALAGALAWFARALRRGPRDPAAMAFVMLFSQVAVTIAGMRSEFDRYHVPMAIFGAVSVGIAVAAAVPVLRAIGQRLASNGGTVPVDRVEARRRPAMGEPRGR